MNGIKARTSSRNTSFRLHTFLLVVAVLTCAAAAFYSPTSKAQALPADVAPSGIRIGERLTYNVSIGRFPNAAYAELYTVSRGRLADKEAIELRAKFTTLELASATFYMVDETRTTFMSPATGLPLHTVRVENASGLPKETSANFLTTPTPHFDLLTLIHRLRQSGGTGSVTLQENDKVFTVTFQPGLVEKQKTTAGEFETTVVVLQSDYFTEMGLTDVKVNLSTDEAKVPVLIRFKTAKGLFKAGLASVQLLEPEIVPQPSPVASRTPVPERTPKPPATPVPYVDNQPLSGELAFELGESLEYRIVTNGQPVARMNLAAKERKQFNGIDTLVLEALFTEIRPGPPFAAGDFIRAYVDPDTLAPRQIDMRFAGALRAFSKTTKFEREGSLISFGGTPIEAPVGTHSVLSLLYAARSFNLKPSRDLNNPINDTRVAVFWETEPYIFTLRPSPPEVLTIDGKPNGGQLISVTTKNPVLDQMNIKIWLGNDEGRIPLRFMVGPYQADLIAVRKGPQK